uniref:Bee-milk protein n=1 Tax=Anopheles culicifacies TaxID=139723 RepID=A0A182MFR8_9DIPT
MNILFSRCFSSNELNTTVIMHGQNNTSRILCIALLILFNEPLQTIALQSSYMETIKQWNLLSYNFPWDYPVENKDFYNAENVVATGIEVGYNRIFLATPRLFSGVPATLSSISRDNYGDSPTLEAYPSWSHHRSGTNDYNCTDIGLVSVYRIRIDSCNRLWALDAGVSRSLEDFDITCPPKILVYDLYTNQVVRRIDFPAEVIRGESLLTNIIVDETTSRKENHCDDVFVYITDTVAPGIVVYDSEKDLTWRLSHPAMYPDPDFAESRILDHRFTLMDGVVGMAFDPEAAILYFQPLATDRLFSVNTAALRLGPLEFGKDLPVKLVGRKSSQGIGLAAAPQGGTIFYSPLSETAVASWNPRTNEHRLLAQDKERIQFAADLRTPERDGAALYVLTSKFHRFFLKNLNAKEINTRILRIDSAWRINLWAELAAASGLAGSSGLVVKREPPHLLIKNQGVIMLGASTAIPPGASKEFDPSLAIMLAFDDEISPSLNNARLKGYRKDNINANNLPKGKANIFAHGKRAGPPGRTASGDAVQFQPQPLLDQSNPLPAALTGAERWALVKVLPDKNAYYPFSKLIYSAPAAATGSFSHNDGLGPSGSDSSRIGIESTNSAEGRWTETSNDSKSLSSTEQDLALIDDRLITAVTSPNIRRRDHRHKKIPQTMATHRRNAGHDDAFDENMNIAGFVTPNNDDVSQILLLNAAMAAAATISDNDISTANARLNPKLFNDNAKNSILLNA